MSWPEPGDIARLKHPAETWGWKEFGPKEERLLAAGREALRLLDAYANHGAKRPNDQDRVAVRMELADAISSLVADGEAH